MQKISYADLNARQQESYNYQKVAGVLADYGFITIRLSDDWNGADFIAQHIDGITFLKVQLKGRLTVDLKYKGRDVHICFRNNDNEWFLYPHDIVMEKILNTTGVGKTASWALGLYTFPKLSKAMREMLDPYRLQS